MKTLKKIELRENLWSDDRGWGIHLLNAAGLSSKSIGDLHLVSIKPGKIRGNHYHEKSTEWLLFLNGKAKLIWRELGTPLIHKEVIRALHPIVYRIPPKIEHAVINTDQHEIYLSSISDAQDRGTLRSINLIETLKVDN